MTAEEEVNYPPESELNYYYLCVGRVAMGWAMFEAKMNHAIWRLAGIEQYAGACLTAQIMAPSARFRALIALAKFRGTSDVRCDALNRLSVKVDKVARQRNRVVHDPSFVSDGNMYRLHITADRSIDFGMKPMEPKDFAIVEVKIKEIIENFEEQTASLFEELPPYDLSSFSMSDGLEFVRTSPSAPADV